MKHYKNKEISDEFAVSQPTVANWIKDTLNGKKELELIEINDKFFIARSQNNIKLIKDYISLGFKYKPTNKRLVVEAKPEFIKHLNDKQIIEIKKNLTEKKLIDVKYVYMDGGANVWNDMYDISAGSAAIYDPYNKMNLLSVPLLLQLIGKAKINVFDIGAGNGKPVVDFLQDLYKNNSLGSYIAIDISSQMNEMAIQNVKKKFPKLDCIPCILDVENNSFEEIVYEISQDHPNSINVFLLYGGTFGNFNNQEKALFNIEKSMFSGDFLFLNNFSPNPYRFNDEKYMYESPTVDHYLFVARGLGLRVGPEDLEYSFNLENKERQLSLVLPSDYTIKLPINDKDEKIDLPKDTRILVWKHKMTNLNFIQSITKSYDLNLVLYTISSDNKFILTCYKKETK